MGDVRNYLNRQVAAMHQVNISRLERIGLQFVIDARTKADFTDQTGNLRSSIGYIVLFKGEVVASNFEGKTAEGQAKALEIADDVANKEYHPTYALIVVAGMEYAAAVESNGKDVISGSSLKATQSLDKYFKR